MTRIQAIREAFAECERLRDHAQLAPMSRRMLANRCTPDAIADLLRAYDEAVRDAERWRHVARKLCLTGNGDGTCAMQAINLPGHIPGWPEPGEVAEFCGEAIDRAIRSLERN